MTDDKSPQQKRAVIASPKKIDSAAVDGTSRGPFADLRRRIQLTIRYHGWRTLLFRVLTLPLRFTPLRHRVRLRSHGADHEYRRASAWYREWGRAG